MVGGARPGAGRKKGGKNVGTIEKELMAKLWVDDANRKGLLPNDIFRMQANRIPWVDGTPITAEQLDAAKAWAPYIHPRLSSVTQEVSGPGGSPLKVEEIRRVIVDPANRDT